MDYTTEAHKYGVVVRGRLPVSDLPRLMRAWKRKGFTELHQGIAIALEATMVVTKPEHAALWLEEVRAAAAIKAKGDPELTWLCGPDTGISSLTMFSVLSYRHRKLAIERLRPSWPSTPRDPDDFGRCYRLLEAVPGWRERLDDVASTYPAWAGLVSQWLLLEKIYLAELPSGRAPQLYAAIQKLTGRA